ncbi:hypothetical protein MPTK1_3g13620 [Marchantia polymorpha subsp. ruderalis]|uniref:S-protein homolog n=2 Tax=Marchantia polymorpha TaxID=3197 RepID=A0AAF6B0G4_MARPO|nr:hypothetical protein MARPO_0004s0309 [Marchantia polymorpha]BBN05498.1 hypothetical protein Mp_3g13620 [Marchantia polymorpha subsp. ruderalis]|eukprot:PTQ49087.1 hypothetical protein MARPO_0004s0309 [Marchantia polymorpha]
MARFTLTPCSVVLVSITIWLSLSMVASAAANRSFILNALTDNYKEQEVFVQCTCVYDTYRRTLTPKFLLRPDANTTVEVDQCPGVKQVECDITRYSRPPNNEQKYYMKVLAWYFKGPSETKFKFDNGVLYYAVAPDLNNWMNSGLVWTMDAENYYTPKFLSLKTASENGLSREI